MNREGWEYVEASRFCSNVTDGTHESPKSTQSGKPLITSKHIKGRNIDFESAYLISVDDYEKINKRSQVEQWDVIISMIGEYCGYCYVERNNIIEYAVKNVGVFKAGNQVDAEWLYYYLNSSIGKAHLLAAKSGSSQPYLTLGALRSLPILVPTEAIKKKIVQTISAIDAKIDINNRINAELEAMAKTLYNYWFVQFDFPDKNGKPYKSSGGKMVWNKELKREIPVGWEAGSLVDLGNIVGGSTPSTTDPENFSEQGTPWITPKDLADNSGNKFISKGALAVTAQGMKRASLKLYPKETVLLSSRAPIGYMAIARNPVTTNQGFKSIIPNKGYSSSFVYYTLKNSMKTIVQYASGSTFKEVSGTVLKTVLVCLPDKKVVEVYTKSVSSLFEQQDILEQENQHLSSLRNWLLPMLMNGQVTVR